MRIKFTLICMCIVLFVIFLNESNVKAAKTVDSEFELHAVSAALIDASNNRLLYGKNSDEVLPMASTTKIMTLVIALEYGNLDDVVTVSKYAASQPDVQLNAQTGEQYYLKDLLYAMMLRSYNDVAVAVAEYVGEKCTGEVSDPDTIKKRSQDESKKYIKQFAKLMNEKANELGCTNTYFITPNGLDASDENGRHSTTAYELGVMASYAIKNEKVIEICTTKNWSFNEINGKRNVSVSTTDRFLDMQKGAVGLKTGFTGEAGYCFVGAVVLDGRAFVSVVLGCGWPPAKTYKWADTKKIMNYGMSNYFEQVIFNKQQDYKTIAIEDGTKNTIDTCIDSSLKMLISDNENIKVIYELKDSVTAPVSAGEQVGTVYVYIDDEIYECYPITSKNTVKKVSFWWCLQKIFSYYTI